MSTTTHGLEFAPLGIPHGGQSQTNVGPISGELEKASGQPQGSSAELNVTRFLVLRANSADAVGLVAILKALGIILLFALLIIVSYALLRTILDRNPEKNNPVCNDLSASSESNTSPLMHSSPTTTPCLEVPMLPVH